MKLGILARIRNLQNEIGEGVTEDVLTNLIRAEGALCEYGFKFLCVSDGFAVFEVPEQNIEDWYGQKRGWPAAAKEQLVRKIAEKYHLEVFKPPDEVTISGECRHHFELDRHQGKLVVAHPRYPMICISKWPIFPELTIGGEDEGRQSQTPSAGTPHSGTMCPL